MPLSTWELVHAYRTASTNGLVPTILCPDCEAELVPTADKKKNPAFRCLACLTIFSIGLVQLDQMRANLKELNG